MDKRIYFIVGDTFSELSKRIGSVLSESEVIEAVLATARLDHDVHLMLQQGVDAHMISRAVNHFNQVKRSSNGQYFVHFGTEMPRAIGRQAHKARGENICVSAPRRISDVRFELDLHLSAHNELFQDHMTGLHIQGMVLTEASRQAFLVVTEEYFLKDRAEKSYFVIKRMNASFQSFVFPFAAKLDYEILQHTSKPGRESFDVRITTLQAGIQCATLEVSFTTFAESQISRRELELATERLQGMAQALDTAFGGHAEAAVGVGLQ